MYKAHSILTNQESCREFAERAANPPLEYAPKESILLGVPNFIISTGFNIVQSILSYSKSGITNSYFISKDIVSCGKTIITETSNVFFGEEFSMNDLYSHIRNISPKELYSAQLEIPQQIFNYTVQIVKNLIMSWWKLRIIMHYKIYSAINSIVLFSSESSQSTWPVSKLSSIISKLSGLFSAS